MDTLHSPLTTSPLISWFDPFLGVDRGGNVLCGPFLPLSLARPGPDTLPPHNPSGYNSDKPIIGFSQNHVSGTGGQGRYGNVRLTPFVGSPTPEERVSEEAAAGWYRVRLCNGIAVEITSTDRTALYQIEYPTGGPACLLVDGSSIIVTGDLLDNGGAIASTGGHMEWTVGGELVGHCDLHGGWGHPFPYSVFFAIRFEVNGLPLKGDLCPVTFESDLPAPHPLCADGPNVRAIVTFPERATVLARVGLSYVSVAKARASLDRESGHKTFPAVRAQAEQRWEESFSAIRVTGGTDSQRRLFYTSFARLLCMPTDLGVDDENPWMVTGRRSFTDYYCLWDSVRNANSFIALFAPELHVAMMNDLLAVADQIGWLPDAWVAGHSAFVQGGSSVDLLFCESALKEIEGIDYEAALRQMLKNNRVESPDPRMYGRYLADYRDLGYVAAGTCLNCVSRTLEYAYGDWCAGKLAEHLGHGETAEECFASSQKLWNLWREDVRSFGPKDRDGAWVAFDRAICLPDAWNDPWFYEGNGLQWSFSAHGDFAGLIERHGGPEEFVAHLDKYFDEGNHLSKETILHVPYLYTYAGRPDRTMERSRQCLDEHFHEGRAGLSDNEDMGCQSTYFMATAVGLYPIMGQDLWLLTTPIFPRTEIKLGSSGNRLIIEAPGADEGLKYIASATLNGQPLERAWLRHHEIAKGALLTLTLSATPTTWAFGIPPDGI